MSIRVRQWVVWALLLALAGTAQAAPYAERVVERTFANGLKVLVLEDHKAPVGVIQVWYRVGSRNENLGRTGLSHLLEHMMFKGTKKVGPEEYSRIIQRNGGDENAFTSQDYTTYFATLASDRLHVAAELEADRMANLVLDEKQFEPEHAVVLEERRLRTDDNPTSALFEMLSATAYVAHPYEWPVIGWMNDIEKATRDDVLGYYRRYYNPGNAFVVIVGDVSAAEFMKTLEKEFGAVPAAVSPPPALRAEEPPQEGERRVVLRKEAELPFVAMAFHVPSFPDPDSAPLSVLEDVLSGGRSTRLYDELVYKQRLALSVGASYDDTSKDPGLFVVYGQPLPGKTAAAVEKALLEQIDQVQKAPVTARELQKVKNGVEASFVLAQDSLFYQGLLLGQYEILGDWRLIDRYVPAINAVTADDVQRVAKKYLTASNRTVATLEPLPTSGKKHRPAAPPPIGGPVH